MMTLLIRWFGRRGAPAIAGPLRDELLSIERLEDRALALAASLTIDPNPRHRARDTFPRFEDNVRVLRAAYRTLADDVRTGAVRRPGRGLAARQLPPRRRRDLRHPAQPAAHLLAHAADAGLARARRPGAHLRDRGRADPPQRQPPRSPAAGPVPQQLPARRAADDRRALGVAEHAEAGADREPAPAGRGAADRARPRAPRPTTTSTAADRHGGRGALPPGTRSRVHRPAAPPPARIRAAPVGAARAVDDDLTRRHTTAEETIRGEHQRQGVAQVSVANAITSLRLVRDARLAGVRRSGQPGRAGAAARSGRRLRPHGLPEPRSAAPGRRGAGAAERRGTGARRAESDRDRAAGGGRAARPTDRAAHVGYHLVDRGRDRSRSRPRATARACASARTRAPACAMPRSCTSGSIALLTTAAGRRRGRLRGDAPAAASVVRLLVALARRCCRPASFAHRVSSSAPSST